MHVIFLVVQSQQEDEDTQHDAYDNQPAGMEIKYCSCVSNTACVMEVMSL